MFPGARTSRHAMRAVGEVMSIGMNYKEAFQNSDRSLEKGTLRLGFARNYNK
jgi:carbamoyl-phosphate synthase large subunit